MGNRLPKPLRKQREVLYLSAKGHSAVLGTAGSGKTTLALYRAAYLSDPQMPHYGKTLLLTFNQALVTYLDYLKPSKLRNVHIETYHKFARGYLNSRGKMGHNAILSDPQAKKNLIEKSVDNVARKHEKSKFFERPLDFYVDEIQWILSHGITTEEDYIKIERIGRTGTNLARRLRNAMYEIVQEYLALRKEHGKIYDWDDVAYYTKQEFNSDHSDRLYRHIIVDEGQDFSPEMIRSLVSALPENGSLTFFGDVAQQIYGHRTSWRFAGLSISQAWQFKENYRNTKQIARLGLAISKMPYFADVADMVEPISPPADGPLPTIVRCKDHQDQLNVAVNVAKGSAKTKRVAILFKDRDLEKQLANKLPSSAIRLHRDMGSWQENPGIYYGTYHSSKGLEFDVVILPLLDSTNLPDQEHISIYGEEDALTHDGRLLYVAVTRAKTELLILHSSIITPLLPEDPGLYTVINHDEN